MTGSQKNPARRFSFSNDMARSRGAQDPILSYQELLDAIRSSDLGNQLHHFRVIISPITTNDEEAVLSTLGDRKEDAGDEGFAVVRLLEDGDLFSKTRPTEISASVVTHCNWVWGSMRMESRVW